MQAMPAPSAFHVQAGVSLATMVFCMTMISVGKNAAYYLPVLTSIVGYWLPSPQQQQQQPPQQQQPQQRQQAVPVAEPPAPAPVDPGHLRGVHVVA